MEANRRCYGIKDTVQGRQEVRKMPMLPAYLQENSYKVNRLRTITLEVNGLNAPIKRHKLLIQ